MTLTVTDLFDLIDVTDSKNTVSKWDEGTVFTLEYGLYTDKSCTSPYDGASIEGGTYWVRITAVVTDAYRDRYKNGSTTVKVKVEKEAVG